MSCVCWVAEGKRRGDIIYRYICLINLCMPFWSIRNIIQKNKLNYNRQKSYTNTAQNFVRYWRQRLGKCIFLDIMFWWVTT